MKKLLIGLGIVLLLIGTTAGLMYWQRIGPFSDLSWLESEEEPVEEADFDKPFFVQMDPLVIPLIKNDLPAGNIQLAIKLEVVDRADSSKITKLKPRLADAFLKDLYQYIPRHLRREPQIDLAVIKVRLQEVADRIAGPGVIKKVLVQAVIDNQAR